ncbi:putative Uncharacterized 50.6 kDa protein in the 5\\'region of gyrA and gyrB [Actinacidiphila cocklensis]|uniref:Uncharacterized 50.6 kDa protein in the 5\'region of gyrA and gyrB n=1 Tax=Actinacidiphila cocklensis TaxID=887465 RepID=A0A9W4DQ28_9ACTN|nr:putative Uncharacterized 50.6 kDa protein in the 5\\'region of gyrA and gyrB [Actinacidiphila cocklensis]
MGRRGGGPAGGRRRRISLLPAQRQHPQRRHRLGARPRPPGQARQRLHGHPGARLGLPLGRQPRLRPRQRHRPLGHRDDRPPGQGPQEGQRGQHPAGHPDQPPRLRQARRRHRTGRPAGDVQQCLRGRRAGLRGQDGGEADRAADGPLRRGRLHRLQGPGQRARRGAADHHVGHQRRQEPPDAGRRHPHPRRRPGARPGAHQARRGGRQRPGAHPAAAGVPEGPDGPDQRPGAADQPHQAVLRRRQRDQRRHHRHRPRLGRQADGPRAERPQPEVRPHPHGHPAGQVRTGRPQPGAAHRGEGRDGVGRAARRQADTGRGRPGIGRRQGRRRQDRPPLRLRQPVGKPLTCKDAKPFGWGIIPLPTWFWEMRPVLADWSAGPGSRDANPRSDPAPSRT